MIFWVIAGAFLVVCLTGTVVLSLYLRSNNAAPPTGTGRGPQSLRTSPREANLSRWTATVASPCGSGLRIPGLRRRRRVTQSVDAADDA
jgi:hypothetical protein